MPFSVIEVCFLCSFCRTDDSEMPEKHCYAYHREFTDTSLAGRESRTGEILTDPEIFSLLILVSTGTTPIKKKWGSSVGL